MDKRELKERTKQFALRVIKVVRVLPRSRDGDVIGRQLLRCGTAVRANYRAACRARSRAEFAARWGTVEEEADESALWIELIVESNLMDQKMVEPLYDEAQELAAIMASSRKSALRRTAQSQIENRK